MRRAFRSLVLGLAWASIWPGYLVLVAQAARLGPWPRNLGILASTVLHGLALGLFVPGVLAWMTRRDGWAERFLGIPAAVGRQFCRAGRFLSAAAVVCLVPAYLLAYGEIAPDGRPITAAGFCRFFILAFELAVWASLFRLLRRGSALMSWCDSQPCSPAVDETTAATDRGADERRSCLGARRPRPRRRVPRPGWPGSAGGGGLLAWILLGMAAGYRGARRAGLPLHRPATGQRRVRDPGRLPALLDPESRPRVGSSPSTPGAGCVRDGSGREPSPPPWPCGARLGTAARRRPSVPLERDGCRNDSGPPEDLAGPAPATRVLRGRRARRLGLGLGLGARPGADPVPCQPAALVTLPRRPSPSAI